MTEPNAPFAPDWASPPGDTIADLNEERGWTRAELAERMGYSAKHVNHLVQGNAVLTEDAALRLELVLGASADFWLTREARYRGRVARLKAARFHAEYVRWLDELPVKFPMARRDRECTGEYNSRFPNRRHRCRTAILTLAAILRHVLQAAVSGGCEWIDPRAGFIAMNNNSFHECGFNHADTARARRAAGSSRRRAGWRVRVRDA